MSSYSCPLSVALVLLVSMQYEKLSPFYEISFSEVVVSMHFNLIFPKIPQETKTTIFFILTFISNSGRAV